MRPSFQNSALAALGLLSYATTVQGHSWLEDLRLIASNGTFVGPTGYPRGYVPRGSTPGPDIDMVYKLLPTSVTNDTPMCKASQQIGTQKQGFPPLSAAPQDFIALRYLENGHVTKYTTLRPAGNGTVSVYGTKTPSNSDTYNGIHRVWNAAGTGGDKRGKLLATRHYDDGQCYEPQTDTKGPEGLKRLAEYGVPSLVCQTDIQLPADAGTSGTYTLYWVWEWPELAPSGKVIGPENYTACVDINMVSQPVAAAGPFDTKQNVTSRAIKAQMETAFMVDPAATPALALKAFSSGAPAGAAPTGQPATSSAQNGSASTSKTQSRSAPATAAPAKPTTTQAGGASSPAGQFITVTVTKTVNPGVVTASSPAKSSAPAQSQSQAPAPPASSGAAVNAPASPVIMTPGKAPTVAPIPARRRRRG